MAESYALDHCRNTLHRSHPCCQVQPRETAETSNDVALPFCHHCPLGSDLSSNGCDMEHVKMTCFDLVSLNDIFIPLCSPTGHSRLQINGNRDFFQHSAAHKFTEIWQITRPWVPLAALRHPEVGPSLPPRLGRKEILPEGFAGRYAASSKTHLGRCPNSVVFFVVSFYIPRVGKGQKPVAMGGDHCIHDNPQPQIQDLRETPLKSAQERTVVLAWQGHAGQSTDAS